MGMRSKLQRVARLSPGELLVRAGQAVSVARDRAGYSPRVRISSDARFLEREALGRDAADLLEEFRSRAPHSFFSSFADPGATTALLRRRWPEAEARIIKQAEQAGHGCFDLLGRSSLSFGDPVNWRLEPLAGIRTPLRHWSRIDHLDPAVVGEYKLTWELNRHQHFFALGAAYWLTGDERHADVFTRHLTGWMDANPPGRGINWGSSLELAFRVMSWVWALHFFRDSPRLTPGLYVRALQWIDLHAKHIDAYLSTYFSPNTHLTGEALALVYIGTIFPELRSADDWRQKGVGILLGELERQVRPDGVYFEQATWYHRYTTEFYLHLLLLSRRHAVSREDAIEGPLTALLDHLIYITRPDGTTPLLGDDDGGQMLPLDGCSAADFRPTLATGASLFGRADYRFVAGRAAEHTLWLLGPEGLAVFDELRPAPPGRTSRAFRDGGYYVMRDSWSEDANFLLVDCGPHGTMNCGHAHADALAIDVAAAGASMLADAGTFTYIDPPHLRDELRSSLAHSTIAVDGESSSVPAGPFQWRHTAGCVEDEWISLQRLDFFAGTHDGYMRLPDPVQHRREILFLKGDYWILRDRVIGSGSHTVAARFHLDPRANVDEAGRALVARRGEQELTIAPFAERIALGLEAVPHSGSFGSLEPTTCCTATTFGADREIVTFLFPGTAGRQLEIMEARGTRGRCFQVESSGHADTVLVGSNGVAGAGLASDAKWLWVRRDPATLEVQEVIALDVSRFEIDGEVFLDSPQRRPHWIARFVDGQPRVDEDRSELRTSAGDRNTARATESLQV